MSHSSIILLASTPETQEAPLPAGHCPTVVAKSVSTGDPPMIKTAAGNLLLPQGASPPAGPCLTVAKSVSTGDPPIITTAAGTPLLPQVTAYRQYQLSPRRAHPAPDRSISARPPAAPPMSHPSIILLASNPDIQLSPRRAHHVPDRSTSARPFAVPVRC